MSKYCYCVLPKLTLNLMDRGSYEYNIFNNSLIKYKELLEASGIGLVFPIESETLNSDCFPLNKDELKYTSLLGGGDKFFYDNNCVRGYEPSADKVIQLKEIRDATTLAIRKYKSEKIQDPTEFLHRRIDVLNKRIAEAESICAKAFGMVIRYMSGNMKEMVGQVGDGRLIIEISLNSGSETIRYGGVEISREQLQKLVEVL